MNRRLALLVALCWLALAPAAAAASTAAMAPPAAALAPASPLVRASDGRLLAPDIARIVGRGALVVALSKIESPPFFSDQGGHLHGTDIDLVQAIAAELGVPARFERTATADVAVDMVGNGQADLAVGRIGRTIRRSQMVLFSTPYQSLAHAMLIHRVRFAELYGKRPLTEVMRGFTGAIGVIDGTSWVDNAQRDFPAAPLRRYRDWSALVDAVRRGDVVAAYRDELAVRAVLVNDPRLALHLRTVTFSDAHVSLSVVAGVRDTTLVGFVNEVIAVRSRHAGTAGVPQKGK